MGILGKSNKRDALLLNLHFKKRVEVQGFRQNNGNPSLQQKCEICIAIYGAESWRMNKTKLERVRGGGRGGRVG